LSFGLDAGDPPGASIGANNGVFAWQTTDTHAVTGNYVTVRVTDNGVPPMNDADSFAVLVLPRLAIQSFAVSGPDLVFTWSAIPNTRDRVQFKNNLDDPNWTDLVPHVTANGTTASQSDPLSQSQRFYQVLVVIGEQLPAGELARRQGARQAPGSLSYGTAFSKHIRCAGRAPVLRSFVVAFLDRTRAHAQQAQLEKTMNEQKREHCRNTRNDLIGS
jgi:hypothetical protein